MKLYTTLKMMVKEYNNIKIKIEYIKYFQTYQFMICRDLCDLEVKLENLNYNV